MKELSRMALGVQGSTTLAIDSAFKKMKAEGEDVLGFAAGEPDFPTPQNIKNAAKQAIDENFTKYTPTAGFMPLREAIASRLLADCGVFYAPTQIVAASGAKTAVYAALRVLVNPGDEVILPAPYWVSYLELIQMVGGVPVIVNTSEEQGFHLEAEALEKAITPKTKVVIFNNPCNPTGAMYQRDELIAIAKVCAAADIYVIADEIYYRLAYDTEFISFATLGEDIKERTIVINGVSKSYAMTGWRIGYAAANPQIARHMSDYLSHATAAPCSVAQKAAFEAFSGPQESVDEMKQAFLQRRNYFVQRLNEIKDVSCTCPEGAFYIMMNCSKLLGRMFYGTKINTTDDFAALFLSHSKVAVVPGSSFGAPEFVRWSYATDMTSIQRGLDRLEAFING